MLRHSSSTMTSCRSSSQANLHLTGTGPTSSPRGRLCAGTSPPLLLTPHKQGAANSSTKIHLSTRTGLAAHFKAVPRPILILMGPGQHHGGHSKRPGLCRPLSCLRSTAAAKGFPADFRKLQAAAGCMWIWRKHGHNNANQWMALTTQFEKTAGTFFYWTWSVIPCLFLIYHCKVLVYNVLVPLFVKRGRGGGREDKGEKKLCQRGNFAHYLLWLQRSLGPKKLPARSAHPNSTALWGKSRFAGTPSKARQEPSSSLQQHISSAFPNDFGRNKKLTCPCNSPTISCSQL